MFLPQSEKNISRVLLKLESTLELEIMLLDKIELLEKQKLFTELRSEEHKWRKWKHLKE